MKAAFGVVLWLFLPPLALGGEWWGAAAQIHKERAEPGSETVRGEREWRPAAGVEEEVRKAVAAHWGVDPASLVLHWTPPPDAQSWPALDRVELVGSGRGGWWVAVFRSFSGQPGEVRSLSLRVGMRWRRWVAARPLARGDVLREGDWVGEERVVWGPPPPTKDPPQDGWVVERSLARGEVLEAPAVRPPWLVVAGEKVEVVWTRGSLTLRVPGRAEGSAALGERIWVRTEGGKRLEGRVGGPGWVSVSDGVTEKES